MTRQLNLMTGLLGLGMHLGGWRHKDSWTDQVMNLDHAIEIAKTAEAGKFDLLFLADGNDLRRTLFPGATVRVLGPPVEGPGMLEHRHDIVPR